MTYAKRTGMSTDRVTKDKFYELDGDYHIIDDNGRYMAPKLSNPDYWEIANPPEHTAESQSVKLENDMLTVEPVILINDRKSDQFTTEDIIDLVIEEEAKIKRLNAINTKSPEIEKLKYHHQNLIRDLLKVLENRD